LLSTQLLRRAAAPKLDGEVVPELGGVIDDNATSPKVSGPR
jgi:hypothetical protein